MSDLDLQGLIRQHSAQSVLTYWDHMLPSERLKTVGPAVRDRLIDVAVTTYDRYHKAQAKTVYYLSMEFLIGQCPEQYLWGYNRFKGPRSS